MYFVKKLILLVFIAVSIFATVWNYTAENSVFGAPTAVAPLKAPRGVSATDGDHIDKVNVMWSAVRGANLYRVFRSTINDSVSATPVGTTAANYYFDTTAQIGQTYFYWVRAENGSDFSSLSLGDDGRRVSGSFHSQFFSPLSAPPTPVGNDVSAAKASLGKTLFWDEQLSSTMTVACGTCHRPAAGGADPRTSSNPALSRNPGPDNVFNTDDDVFGSAGVPQNSVNGSYTRNANFGLREQVTGRKSPSYLNAALSFNGAFWDGRASAAFRDPITNSLLLADFASLESQSMGPPLSAAEMAHANRNWTEVAAQLTNSKPLALAERVPVSLSNWIDGRTYSELFTEAFGSPEITPSRIAFALATHQRTLFSDRTPIDRWASLIENLTAEEDRGRIVFQNASCTFCHSGPVFADQNFHNIGVRPTTDDPGRGAVSGNNNDIGRFKTPTLRNIELRAPYMHNGRIATLEEVVEFYNRGGDFNAGNINRGLVRPLGLSAQQKADLVAFLKRPFTDLRVKNELAPFDRPKLYSESTRVPVISGTGRNGSAGIAPLVTAIEPPLAGNPNFTVAISEAPGAANAVVVIDSVDPGVGTSVPASGSFARQSIVLAGSGNGGFGSVNLAIPNDPAFVGQTFFGRWYVTDAGAANGFSVSRVFSFTVFGQNTAISRDAPADFDGDGRTDISIFRPAPSEWWYSRSTDGNVAALQFGANGDRVVPADFTGDGIADIAVWRPANGNWFVLRSEDSSFYSFPFGSPGDIPLAADFDADGRADAAVFRPSVATWFVNLSSGGTSIQQFGINGDLPAVSDYDGDGRADIAIFRPSAGEWWIQRSSGGTIAFRFGVSSDKAVPGDYTGDGRTDAAIFRPSTGDWFILRSEDSSYFSVPFGTNGDQPAPGDYDGDGKTDIAVFRPSDSTWYVQRSTAGILFAQFGQNGDTAVPNALLP